MFMRLVIFETLAMAPLRRRWRSKLLSLLVLCLGTAAVADPLFPNSVASNDLDFIRPDDPGACWSMAPAGVGRTEMYDSRSDTLFVEAALHFDVRYPEQTLRINVHPDVGDPEARAGQAAASVSRLPRQMRDELRYVNILNGDGSAWAEDLGRFFTLYDGLMARRLAEHDLDETVFHETAHVALDGVMSADPDWASNQAADGGYVTRYAAENPRKEDVAESALFAWTMTHYPGRLPAPVEARVREIMPNRLEYLGNMLAEFQPPDCTR